MNMSLVFSAFISSPVSLIVATGEILFFLYSIYASDQYINIISINKNLDNNHKNKKKD